MLTFLYRMNIFFFCYNMVVCIAGLWRNNLNMATLALICGTLNLIAILTAGDRIE